MTYLAAGLLLLGIAAAILLFTPVGQGPLDRLFKVGEVEPFDFANLALSDKPNQFLLCPPDLCGTVSHAESPSFPVPVDALTKSWRALASAQPRVTLLAESADGLQLDYLQRSARFRYPDIITVRFIPLSPEASTLAIYSRSLYGKSDFGVNRERIENWLELLGEKL